MGLDTIIEKYSSIWYTLLFSEHWLAHSHERNSLTESENFKELSHPLSLLLGVCGLWRTSWLVPQPLLASLGHSLSFIKNWSLINLIIPAMKKISRLPIIPYVSFIPGMNVNFCIVSTYLSDCNRLYLCNGPRQAGVLLFSVDSTPSMFSSVLKAQLESSALIYMMYMSHKYIYENWYRNKI